ncbi:MAG TPA: hypothetical protein VHQ01_00535, partial [Pyrinomonadaceae bacterium]|nr:hypothetical protein [Pyrinomonadaceae bacterium]
MKRCPQCGREYDNTMMFCLDDGAALLYGPASMDEPATAILSAPPAVADGLTRSTGESEAETAILQSSATAARMAPSASQARSFDKRLFAIPFLLVIITFGGFFGYRYLAPTKQINSIAVMPFVNDSGNADVEYLSDGMTETLIRTLSQLPNLNVKARSSVFRYKGKDTDAKTIGNELGVQAVLNGRVIQRGDQLQLSLELIDPQTENVIWTDQYDRRSSDLVSLQSEIARDVSGKLRLKLSGTDQQKLTKNYTVDAEAYRLYLQGRFYWNKRTFSEVAKGVPYFKQAVERDPNFALGYVGLADSDE